MGGGGVIGGGGVGGGGDGFKPHIELPNPTGPGVSTVQFPIPAQKCGLIIGKGTTIAAQQPGDVHNALACH